MLSKFAQHVKISSVRLVAQLVTVLIADPGRLGSNPHPTAVPCHTVSGSGTI